MTAAVNSAAITRIAMWSGPRNLSTAMMRSWENRPDTAVYLRAVEQYAHHDEAPISYQKHMAHHLPTGPDGLDGLDGLELGWLDGLRNCLLLRDPRRVLASYTKVRDTVTLDDIGIPQQASLASRCELIIDSDDFLANPGAYQREICSRLDVPLDDETLAAMLHWPAGRRDSDGVWAPHWYSAVEASTGFGPPAQSDPPTLPQHLQRIADEALEIYRDLKSHRLVLT